MAAQPGRYDAAQRELAYREWRDAGQNMAETLRRLDREHDWPLSKQTLQDWRDQLGWIERAAADQAEAKRRDRAEKTDRLAMVASLDLQIARYQEAFSAQHASGETADPRAVSAWSNLLRLRLDLIRDVDSGAGLDRADLAAEALEWLSTWVAERLPQHGAVLSEILTAAAGPLAEHFARA